jgi:hypothetical protein
MTSRNPSEPTVGVVVRKIGMCPVAGKAAFVRSEFAES